MACISLFCPIPFEHGWYYHFKASDQYCNLTKIATAKQEKKQLQAFQLEQVQVGQTPAGLVKTCDFLLPWLEVSPSRVSRLDESILFVLASWPDATPQTI